MKVDRSRVATGVAYGLDICFSLAMAVTRAIALAGALVAVLAGCANTASVEESRAEWLVDERDTAAWFCETAENGGWDCVQDPDRVANPRPVRLPKPLFALPSTPEPGPIPPSPPPANAQPSADTPVRTESADPTIPLYQQLSYQPDRPTDLADLPDTYYAIQLIALSSQADLEQFIVDNDLPLLSGAAVENNGERFYALLAGIYTDLETAERAARSLPEELNAHDPWIRSMESLQAAMARAEQLPE